MLHLDSNKKCRNGTFSLYMCVLEKKHEQTNLLNHWFHVSPSLCFERFGESNRECKIKRGTTLQMTGGVHDMNGISIFVLRIWFIILGTKPHKVATQRMSFRCYIIFIFVAECNRMIFRDY